MENNSRSVRPSTSRTGANVEHERQVVRSDPRLTVRLIASELGINHDNVWKIIHENLGIWEIFAKMVPKLLNDDQKELSIYRGVRASSSVLKSNQTC